MAAEYSKLAAEATEKEENSSRAIGDLNQRKLELETIVDMQRRQISDLNASLAVHGNNSHPMLRVMTVDRTRYVT